LGVGPTVLALKANAGAKLLIDRHYFEEQIQLQKPD
jgi:hypothetical protein